MTTEQSKDFGPQVRRMDRFGRTVANVFSWSLVVGVIGLGLKGSAVAFEHLANKEPKDLVLNQAASRLRKIGDGMVEASVTTAVVLGTTLIKAGIDTYQAENRVKAARERVMVA